MFRTIANKIALAAIVVSMTQVVVLGWASYIFTRLTMEEQIHEKLGFEASFIRNEIASLLVEINNNVRSLSKNLIIVNALIDSQGRDIYIEPFMQSYKLSNELPFFIELCDFEGKPISGNHKELRAYSEEPIVDMVIEKELPLAVMRHTLRDPSLLLIYPVFYGATGMAEGMLVIDMPFGPIVEAALKANIDTPGSLLNVTAGGNKVWSTASLSQLNYYSQILKIEPEAPLAQLKLNMEYGLATEKIYSPLRKLTAIYLSLGVIVLFLTLFLSRYLSQRLTFPLKIFSETADEITRTGVPDRSIVSPGNDEELKVLSVSFNTMLQKLYDSQQTLEQRVEERTRSLAKLNKRLHDYADTQRVLLSEVNHRVKNNLTAIIGMLHQEEDRARDEGMGIYASRLSEVVGRISGLLVVHSLLSSSRWAPLSLAYLCDNIIQGALKSISRDKKVSLVKEAFDDVHVSSDQAHYLAIVLNELAINSVKYSFAGRLEATIRYTIISRDDSVILTYHDDGPGYPEGVLGGEFGKARIGLPLIMGIIGKSMGGEIEFYNENGATTRITFPGMVIEKYTEE